MDRSINILDMIRDVDHYYFSSFENLRPNTFRNLMVEDFKLYRLIECQEKECSKRIYAQDTILTALKEECVYFMHLILGCGGKIYHYYGIIPDLQEEPDLAREHVEAADEVLKCILNISWCPQVCSEVSNDEKMSIICKLHEYRYVSYLEGVPARCSSSNAKGYSDEIENGMGKDDFALLYLGRPLSNLDIADLDNRLSQAQRQLSVFDGRNIVTQRATSNSSTLQLNNVHLNSSNHSQSVSKGISFLDFIEDAIETKKEIESFLTSDLMRLHPGFTFKDSPTLLHDLVEASKNKDEDGSDVVTYKGVTKNESESLSRNKLCSNSRSIGNNTGKTRSRTTIVTQFERNHGIKAWEDYINEDLGKRAAYSRGHAGYLMNTTLLTNHRCVAKRLETILRCCYCGEDGMRVPCKSWYVGENEKVLEAIYQLQIPIFTQIVDETIVPFTVNEQLGRSVLSQLVYESSIAGGYFVSSRELSQMTAPPYHSK
ncbi:putative ATP-binding protein [Lachnospiraceae bacterium KM106-2]|nr:putative ATP-binding protein [Lachnospiraceae bacterium KM106-2]